MIYTTLDRLARYRGLCPSLDTAIDYLATADLSALKPGRNEVDGDNVFINRFGYTTLPQAEAAWEGHARLTPTTRDEASDFIGYDGPVDAWCPMAPGTALIVFPEDVHMVKVQKDGPVQVEKAVFKLKV